MIYAANLKKNYLFFNIRYPFSVEMLLYIGPLAYICSAFEKRRINIVIIVADVTVKDFTNGSDTVTVEKLSLSPGRRTPSRFCFMTVKAP